MHVVFAVDVWVAYGLALLQTFALPPYFSKLRLHIDIQTSRRFEGPSLSHYQRTDGKHPSSNLFNITPTQIKMAVRADTPFDPQSKCHLARLPAELRVAIYRLAFAVDDADDGTTKVFPHRPPRSDRAGAVTPPSVLALLETCKLFYQDAEPYFYEVNNLQIKVPTSGVHLKDHYRLDIAHLVWWKRLTTKRREAVREMTAEVRSASQMLIILRIMGGLPRLRKLNLTVHAHTTQRMKKAKISQFRAGDVMTFQRFGNVAAGKEAKAISEFFARVGMFKRERGIEFVVREIDRQDYWIVFWCGTARKMEREPDKTVVWFEEIISTA